MNLRTHDQSEIADWLMKKVDKYISPEIQNEILALMGTTILHVLAGRLQQTDFWVIVFTVRYLYGFMFVYIFLSLLKAVLMSFFTKL